MQLNGNQNLKMSITPIWAFAQSGFFVDSTSVVVCPIQNIPEIQEDDFVRCFIVIYGIGNNEMDGRIFICRHQNGSTPPNQGFIPGTFTGLIDVADLKGNLSKYTLVMYAGEPAGGIEQENEDESGDASIDMVKAIWIQDGADVYWDSDHNLHIGTDPVIIINLPDFSGLNGNGEMFGGGSGPGSQANVPVNILQFHNIENPLMLIEDYLGSEFFDVSWYKLTASNRQMVASNEWLIDVIHDFIFQNNNTQSAWNFANDFLQIIAQYDLSFISVEDMQILFETEELYNKYKDVLSQFPNATLEEKKIMLEMAVLSPTDPINDLFSRLSCFNTISNTSFNHKVTLFIDQPKENSDSPATSKEKAGHTWIMLEQDQGANSIVRLSIGFYPNDWATPCYQIDGGAYNDDEGHPYDISITYDITDWGFNILVNDLKSEPFPPLYDLSNYNCTTFALEKLNHIGIVIPAQPTISLDAPAPCHVEGFAPGAVGQFLRNEYQLPAGAFKNLNGGITPESTNCQ